MRNRKDELHFSSKELAELNISRLFPLFRLCHVHSPTPPLADDKQRGYVFDGTCNGDGTGGTGQCIQDILATLTMTINVVVVEVPATATVTTSGARRGGRMRRYL